MSWIHQNHICKMPSVGETKGCSSGSIWKCDSCGTLWEYRGKLTGDMFVRMGGVDRIVARLQGRL